MTELQLARLTLERLAAQLAVARTYDRLADLTARHRRAQARLAALEAGGEPPS